jgi:beta-glucosidase
MHRIEALLAQMTLEEKVGMLAGSGQWHTTGVARLGIPPIKVTDGPNGARGDSRSGATAACFPVGSALAASWNTELIEQVGAALGQEARSKGAQVLLGPTVNIHRSPLGGRNFECYSEDPHLTARMAVAFVRGVQSQGVGTSVKHFVCNDSEFERHSISSEVGERALREIYLVPFESTVREADPWTIMAAYNRINGTFACSHHPLLTEVLKEEWGFAGFVVSDWGASLETVANANGGLDLEMPGPGRTLDEKLTAAVRAGDVSEKTIDDKVRRLLRITILSGRLDAPEEIAERAIDRPEHRVLARRAAAESMVLLRNEGDLLPLAAAELRAVAVIGPNAEVGQLQGGGSSGVQPHYEVHPLEALRERFGADVTVHHEVGCKTEKYVTPFDAEQLRPASGEDRPGLTLEYWNNADLGGTPVLGRVVRRSRAIWFNDVAPEVDFADFSARYSGSFTPLESGLHTFGLMSAGLSRMYLDDELILDNWTQQTPGDAFFAEGSSEISTAMPLEALRPYELRIEFRRPESGDAAIQFGVNPPFPEDAIERAVAAAARANVAIVVVGTSGEWESEGHDRLDMRLPGRQDELIERVVAANPRTIVVLNSGSPVSLPWLERVPAVIQAWLGGQEFGHALADVLCGDVNPSGRLVSTFPVRLEDTPAFTNYPGENGRVDYGEGIFVGYRWYDTRRIEPRVPFGHGLSFTTFEYGPLEVAVEQARGAAVELSVEITNSGDRAGQEVVQLYLHDRDSRLARPEQELVAFHKVALEPGEKRRVEFSLDDRSLSYWDPALHAWVAEPGEFELRVGASSRDLRSRASFNLK